jgi:hypothetical protein
MSAIFYVYRNGKKEKGYKYEDLNTVWYTQTKENPPTPQISLTFKSDPTTTHNSWGHGPDDQKLTEESIEKAMAMYNEIMEKIGHKKRKSDDDSHHKKKHKK